MDGVSIVNSTERTMVISADDYPDLPRPQPCRRMAWPLLPSFPSWIRLHAPISSSILELDHFRPTASHAVSLRGTSTFDVQTENSTPLLLKTSSADQVLDRDLRLDLCRGIALWFVFLDHIPDNICSWLTLSHYGFSDATEVFMFVSGVTCALSYGVVQRQNGWRAVLSHTTRRALQLYAAFLVLIVAIVVVVYLLGGGQSADETNVRILLQQPEATLAHAVTLQYRPVNTDVLPVFVLSHLLFAPLLWLLRKLPNTTFAASAILYGLVQVYGWNLPQWPSHYWFFNPFAWQFLVVLGAWWVTTGRRRLRGFVTSRPAASLAAAYLAFSLVVALSWSIKPLEALIPSFLAKLIYPIDKSDLDPLRLLHFLAIAILVARFVHLDWRGLATPVLRGAVRCGENSLEVYCLGVLLALVAHVLLLRISGGVAAQVTVSAVGILLIIGFATVSTWATVSRRRQPRLL